MTPARRVIEGQSVMVQRRTMYRMFLLLPTLQTRSILAYCLGYVSQNFSVQIHEFIFLSNHYHLVLTDPLGELPAFMRNLNSLIARALNASNGRWESVWSPGSYCAPTLCEGEDIFDKCVYTLCNINKAGIVRYVQSYEGLSSWNLGYGDQRHCHRPEGFFSEDMPRDVDIVLTRPANVRPDLDDRELRREIRLAVRSREDANAYHIRDAGGSFMGMERMLRQHRTDTPGSVAPRRGIQPRVAGHSTWRRIEAIQRNQDFQDDYREARLRFEGGDHSVVFPHGTYKLRITLGVSCHQPP